MPWTTAIGGDMKDAAEHGLGAGGQHAVARRLQHTTVASSNRTGFTRSPSSRAGHEHLPGTRAQPRPVHRQPVVGVVLATARLV